MIIDRHLEPSESTEFSKLNFLLVKSTLKWFLDFFLELGTLDVCVFITLSSESELSSEYN